MVRGRPALAALAHLAVVVALATAGACDEPARRSDGCANDEDCPDGTSCKGSGACVAETFDAGFVVIDAGGPLDAGFLDGGNIDAGAAADAGPNRCIADALGNGTDDTPWAMPSNDAGTQASAHMCPDVPEYFSFWGFSAGDPVQVIIRWEVEADLDFELRSPASSTTSALDGASAVRRLEIATGALAGAGTQLLRVFAFDSPVPPPEGVPLDLQVRTGLPCLTDDDCFATGTACLMPVWVPYSPTGDPPDFDLIFAGGMCAPGYRPCPVADSATAEGISDRRSNAIDGAPPTGTPAWSCGLDEDWYRYVAPLTGDVNVGFANGSQVPATFIVGIYDEIGNMVGGAGYDELPAGQTRTMTVPKVRSGTVLYVRVMQLNENDGGLYTIAFNAIGATCFGDGDCMADENLDYGRTRCLDTACECVDNPLMPGRCTPQ